MDNPNPIAYSDLIKPDSSITDLIAQIEELIKQYDALRGKLQTSATEMAKSMQSVSGATEEQRQSIELVTKESDKLLAEYSDTEKVLKGLHARYNDITQAQKETAKIQKLVDQVNRSAEGSYNQLSAQYRLNKIRLDEMSQAQREGTKAGRELEAETRRIYERMNELQKATGKAQLQVGQYERALGRVVGVNVEVVSTLTDASKATQALGGVMKALAGPIGIIVGVVGGAIAVFKLFKESIHSTQTSGDNFDMQMAGWSATWEVFKKSVASVDFSNFIERARRAAEAGRDLAAALDEAFERTNSIAILRAKMSEENKQLEEGMRDARKSYQERLKDADAYLESMNKIYDAEVQNAKDVRDAQLRNLFESVNNQKYATEEEEKAAKERFALYIQDYALNRDKVAAAKQFLKDEQIVANEEKALRQQSNRGNLLYDYAAAEQRKKAAEERIALASNEVREYAAVMKQYNMTNDEAVKAYVDSEKAYYDAMYAQYGENKRIITMRNNLEAQAANEQKKAQEERMKNDAAYAKEQERLRQQEITDARAVLNAQLQSIQLQIAVTQEGTQEILALRLAMIKKQKEIELFENQQKAEQVRQDEAAIEAKYNALALKEEAKFNTQMAERDLAAAQDLAKAEFELLDKNEREKTLFRLAQEKARLEAILEIDKTATEKMTELEIDAIRKTIEGINKQTATLGYDNIYELLGIDLNKDQQSAVNKALDSVKEALGSVMDAWEKAAEAAVKSADKQVDAAQKILDAEIEARNNGYANNVANAQKELELAKKTQAEAQKERERAQKAQLAADSIEQASSLVTASANLWKSLSGLGVAGPILAIAAITTMWGSFAASKIKAAQATTESYGEGTVELLQGGSHASGHDIDLGRKPNGVRRRAEGGEYFAVINKRNSRRYGKLIPDVINAFNNGTFADKYQRANAVMGGAALSVAGTDITGLEKNVAAIKAQGEREQFVDGAGNTVIRYKNLTRKIYKS